MSTNNNEKPAAGQSHHQAPVLDHSFPPPPPGPPPAHAQVPPQQINVPHLPDHTIPPYNPSHPQLAPPPASDAGMYDEYPVDEVEVAAKPHGHHGHASKPSWSDRLSSLGSKAAAPLNALANKMGSEGFLPSTMDKEVEKAARILKSFCKDGVYADSHATQAPAPEGDKKAKPQKNRTLLKIPSKVISRAVGLAVFTSGRIGFNVSGATGSGILIARLPDGSWSPPSGIQIHSIGAGFLAGVDIFDCVVVINSQEALDAFKRTRMSFGSDLAVVAGPWGAGGNLDISLPPSDERKDKDKDKKKDHAEVPAVPASSVPAPGTAPQVPTGAGTTTGPQSFAAPPTPERRPSPFRQAMDKPVYSYVKSRGLYAGVQIDGTVITERSEANAAFYGAKVPVEQILKGHVPAGGWHSHVKGLMDAIKGAETPKPNEGGQPATAPAEGANLMTPPAAGSYAPSAGAGVRVGAQGGADVATGMQQMHLGGPPVANPQQPPAFVAAGQSSKAQEAAAESAAQQPASAGPPVYTEQAGGDELPPAYVDDGQQRPVDSKTGH